MPTLQALLQLLDHERRTRDEALQALSRAEGMAGQADAQAQALNVYRNEYIERWSARRLRTALGDTMTADEYDGYRPSTGMDMAALAEAFAAAREETIALAERAADLPESVVVRHNDLGELNVKGWLVYIENHATRESNLL